MRARAPTFLALVLSVLMLEGGTPVASVEAPSVAAAARASRLALAAITPAQRPPSRPLAAAGVAGRARWIDRIQNLVDDRPISVSIGNDGEQWFRHKAGTRRAPASNEKLLLSMALLHRFSLDRTIGTRAMASRRIVGGALRGNLWILGAGDPEIGTPAMAEIADQLVAAGLRRIRGRVIGATTPFVRDWWARGWRDYFPSVYVEIPTALTFRGNKAGGRHIADPERRAARDLIRRLERRGVEVTRGAAMRPSPGGLHPLAEVRSARLGSILGRMNTASSNLRAEVLGKYLGRARFHQPSIDGGARAIEAFVRARGLDATAYDSSGLSYANRVNTRTILKLLWFADGRAWGEALRNTLPTGGQGTLRDRFDDVLVHAKTGTLIDVSALSGWVWLERGQDWAEFSILSSGINASTAKSIENRIVTILSRTGTDPTA
jgi:D-alanyl-D-alanine carboxypeptidase/D-alanyl-D-alanine-endopeptidase (penicillin-binding protein 4)